MVFLIYVSTDIGNVSTIKLPSEYQRLMYLKSNGKCYIDTGVSINSHRGLLIDFAYERFDDNMSILGIYNSAYYQLQFGIYTIDDIKCFYFVIGNQLASTPFDTGIHTAGYMNNKYIFDNRRMTGNDPSFPSIAKNIIVFGRYTFNAIDYSFFSDIYRIYRVRLYDTSNILIRDMIPCFRKSDRVPGMYDVVNNVFYTGSGEGYLIYGDIMY